jgi:hypothetical protein
VYDSELHGEDVTFGTSGFLYQNNKLMYDRTTSSLWHSLTGEPVVGELADSGIRLESYPVTVTTWIDWIEQHPDTTVVDINTGFDRRYLDPSEIGSAYYQYRASPDAMFPTFSVDGRRPEKSSVVGVVSGGESLAFPVDSIIRERVINSSVGDAEITVVGHPLTGVMGVYERNGIRFEPGEDTREIIDESGAIWVVTDGALVGSDGRELARIPAKELFWFAWVAFFPATNVYPAE